MKRVPGGDNFVKDVQCYELFGGIALKNHAFSFHFIFHQYAVSLSKTFIRIASVDSDVKLVPGGDNLVMGAKTCHR